VTPRIRKLYTFPIDYDLARALKAIKAIEGTSEAEQIRQGIRIGVRDWLRRHGHPRRPNESWADVASRLEDWAAKEEAKKADRLRTTPRKRA
jgi:hypothetical protein